ncbi:tyrosine-type recombinase/integrase [Pseudonocardia pini]|uniref:tyrosine-type recombinase/integrase n=1 Tax=Pseudonocardia pini TaxID=2758030 RepID=UPI0015F0DF78|nr:site-specific integrase [Pseudonocardia pini]
MAVDDLWFSSKRQYGPDGRKLPAAQTSRHGRGKRWRVRYTDDTGHKVERLFERKPDAERFDRQVHTDVARGLYIDPVAGRESVAAFAARWLAGQMHRGSTAELMRRTFDRHINPVLGELPLIQVKPSHLQAWVKGLDLAPSSARVAYSYVVSLFGAAVRDRAVATTPCVGIRLPPVEASEHLILTNEQVHLIAEALPARFRALVYVGAGLGLRHGEALGLELEHVDFLRREVRVEQQLTVIARRRPFLAPVKTRTSRRVVELPQITADALARHLEEFPVIGATVSDETNRRDPKERTAQLIFTNNPGRPIHRATWSHFWKPAAEAAGLPPRTGFHALRHYFATLLIGAGASVKTVQMALGHSSPTVTLDTYVGLWPDQVDRTRTLVDNALLGVPQRAVESK